MSVADITSILVSIGSLLGVLAMFVKMRQEQPASKADVAAKYQAIATEQAKRNEELTKCQDEMEQRIDRLEAQWAEAEDYINRLSDAYDELVTVMRGAGLQPVHAKPSRKRIA